MAPKADRTDDPIKSIDVRGFCNFVRPVSAVDVAVAKAAAPKVVADPLVFYGVAMGRGRGHTADLVCRAGIEVSGKGVAAREASSKVAHFVCGDASRMAPSECPSSVGQALDVSISEVNASRMHVANGRGSPFAHSDAIDGYDAVVSHRPLGPGRPVDGAVGSVSAHLRIDDDGLGAGSGGALPPGTLVEVVAGPQAGRLGTVICLSIYIYISILFISSSV